MPNAEEPDMSKKQKGRSDDVGIPAEGLSTVAANHSDAAPILAKEVPLSSYDDQLPYLLEILVFTSDF